MAAKTYSRVLKIAGSTAALAGLLIFFGYLSQSALYGFAGLPMLSLDYTAMVEAGASALVDSIRLTLANGTRGTVLFLGLLISIALWLYREHPRMSRMTRSIRLCLSVQLATLFVVFSLVAAMVVIARQASPARRAETAQQVERTMAELQRERGLGLARESEERWKVTYQIQGGIVGSALDWLSRRSTPVDPSPSDGHLQTISPYGQSLRLCPAAQKRAEDMYGWLFFSAFGLAAAALGNSLWRRWLQGTLAPSPDATSTQRRSVDPTLMLDVCQRLVEPLNIAAAVLAVALLPVSHGVLAHPGIGHEEVIVQLKNSHECRLEGTTPKASPLPADATRDSEPAPANSGASVRNAPGLGGMPMASKAGAESPVTRICTQEQLDSFEQPKIKYANSMRDLLQTHPGEDEYDQLLARLQRSTDDLLSDAAKAGCGGILQAAWLLRPHPAVFVRAPEGAQYFWARWNELLAQSGNLHFGHILHYPRGTMQERLVLFETQVEKTPLTAGHWSIREIRRDCIENTVVVPDLVRIQLDRLVDTLRQEPQNAKAMAGLFLYLQPASLEAALQVWTNSAIPFTRRGTLITQLGTMAGVFRDYESVLVEQAIQLLAGVLGDTSQTEEHRSAAATALHLVGGRQAAEALAGLARKDPNLVQLPTTITAAGFLGQDMAQELEKVRRTLGPTTDVHGLREVHDGLREFLREAAKHASGSIRGTACTALRLSSHPAAGKDILAAAENAFATKDDVALGPCVSALGKLNVQNGRALLRSVSTLNDSWLPREVRRAAFSALYALRMEEEDATIFGLYVGENQEMSNLAASMLEDASEERLGPRLIACATDRSIPNEKRQRCLHGLLLIDKDDDGDAGLVAAVITLLHDAQLPSALHFTGCKVLREFRCRGGQVARYAADCREAQCDESAKEDQRTRWKQYLDELKSPSSDAGESKLSRQQILQLLDGLTSRQ
ncbi:MAG TPA: hypothetical protein VIV60_04005 [Polyangiaceae bacterium]